MRNVHDSDYERITTAGMDTNKRRRRYLLLVVLCVLAFDMEPVLATLAPATVPVHYTDAELEDSDLVAGSYQEEMLSLCFFNPEMQAWEIVEGGTVDPVQNLVSARVTKLGASGVL